MHHKLSFVIALCLAVFLGCSKRPVTEPDSGDTDSPASLELSAKIIPPDVDDLWFYDTGTERFTCFIGDTNGFSQPYDSLKWISDQDGLISRVRSFESGRLSVGVHVLFLRVYFNGGVTAADSLTNLEILVDPFAHTDLLNDRQLRSDADPDAPVVGEAWVQWIEENHLPVRSLNSEDFSDLTYLDDLLADKTLVLMGESAHGIAEQNRLRVRLIKYLHQRLGFSVVAFESGLYECYWTNEEMNHIHHEDALKNSLYGFWHTPDLVDLFLYMKQSNLRGQPLSLAGLDIQFTGDKIASRPQFFRDIISPVDSTFALEIYQTDRHLVSLGYYAVKAYILENYNTLYPLYNNLVSMIEDNSEDLEGYFDEQTVIVAREMAISARTYLDFRGERKYMDFGGRTNVRDHRMFETIQFLRDIVFPDQKIIIWAANGHIIKDADQVTDISGYPAYTKMMGDMIFEEYGQEIYAIGSLCYRGFINYGEVQHIEITRPDAIEAILYHARKKHLFVDFSQQMPVIGNRWMFQKINQTYTHRTGAYDIFYTPRQQFDGLIFIDTATVPDFITY